MFTEFKLAIQRKFNEIKGYDLFRVQVDKDKLWETYLTSFPEGTNPLFRERTEHDCQCCKSFIRAVGNMVAIVDGKLVSIWDVNVGGRYQIVTEALSAFVKSSPIDNSFLHTEATAGIDKNYQETDNGILTWTHFFLQLPPNLVVKKGELIGAKLSESRSTKDVMTRSLKEISVDSIKTVLELIDQNSLYRGEEHKFVLGEFLKLKNDFDRLTTPEAQDIFCWSHVKKTQQSVSRIKNTVIGSLLVDLSEGRDLEPAVASFEAKVAPTNYKRPTSLITSSMVDSAKKKLDELGLTSALERRFATLEDISINNVIYADRSAKKRMENALDILSDQISRHHSTKNMDKVEEVSIDNFVSSILPNAESIEIMLENRHTNNLVSLIAPSDLTAKGMFKWPNNFSWSYEGELTDSIKERVKKAGGKVDGDLRCSLSWFNYDDLDLHMVEPDGRRIYFRDKVSPTSGNLDVDMNANVGTSKNPVENICYSNKKRMPHGVYKLYVNQFCKREPLDAGFEIEIEFDGKVFPIAYTKAVGNTTTIAVAEIEYSPKGFEIIKSLPSAQVAREVWGISTQQFHKVSVVMTSPNHWDEKSIGNKHFFFMLENCVNEKARGFFNEFLKEELNVHRKVFEVVGSKMKIEKSPNQLSGVGFSSTQRNSILCRVKGTFTRVIKVTF